MLTPKITRYSVPVWKITEKYINIKIEGVLMKLKFFYIFCAVLALALGCANPPTAEMDNAREVVFRAENDEDAVLYAGGTLARARDALRNMQVEAESKRYDAAKNHAAEAVAAAERAIAEGRVASSRLKGESESLLAGLEPAIEETSRNINGARYSLLDLDYDQLNQELNTARNSADQAGTDHANGRYNDSLENGRKARAILGSINEIVTGAATLASAKK